MQSEKCVHDTWVVVTQDCNLNRSKPTNNSPIVELRQVHGDTPPTSWGIHARKFLLDADRGHYIVDDKPSLFVSPKYLNSLDDSVLIYKLPPDRVMALKTWLGNRYDRPAVPTEYVDLAKAISEAVREEGRSDVGRSVRDVYMTFSETESGLSYSLYAVMVDEADPKIVRRWLASAALEVSSNLGVAVRIEALYSRQVSLELIENSYCADLSQLTWDNEGEIDGAT
ncbi:hypothetical protein [Amycolatopsis sp. NBC_00438]|uniref:hypothetical protein n=1 Tax=Amycolatopsis sp. NBC_00438 TaxID=2903558 RepID=UPI002E23E47E